jgi:hypothetical protein
MPSYETNELLKRVIEQLTIGNHSTVRRLASFVAWKLSFSVRPLSWVAVSSIFVAPVCSMCSTQADNNSRKLRLPVFFVCPCPYTRYTEVSCQCRLVRQGYALSYPATLEEVPTILRCRGNAFTESLPGTDMRNTHTCTQIDGRDLWSMKLSWAQVPLCTVHTRFHKIASGFQKLMWWRIHRHTASMEIA